MWLFFSDCGKLLVILRSQNESGALFLFIYGMKMRKKLISVILSILTCMACCAEGAKTPKDVVVEMNTSLGTMKIKLYGETPQHQANFLKLVEQGFYSDLLFHRVIKDFMIQGGDPESKGAKQGKMLGAGDVGYTIPAEFVYPKYYHKKGALAAARQGDQVNPKKASSGCQFYIVQGKVMKDAELQSIEMGMLGKAKEARFYEIVRERNDEVKKLRMARDAEGLQKLQTEIVAQMEKEFESRADEFKMPENVKADYKTIGGTPFLDNDYTVFGEVIEGLEVVDKIAAVETASGDRPKTDVKIISVKVID